MNKVIVPADRVGQIKEYYFSKKLKEIEELKKSGKDIISLGIGSPDMPPSEVTIKTLQTEAEKANVHGYQSYTGIVELRNAMSRWYKKWFGIDLDPKTEIQPLIGSKEGILYVSLAFLNKGDKVLVPDPGYPTYSSASRIVEAEVVRYDLVESRGWMPDLEALEKTDLSGVKLMWINYPNMPTGTPADRGLFEQIVAFGKRHGIVICNDNPYSFIANEGEKLSLLGVEGARDICIELNSLSKSHNMAGWRVGMACSNPQFIEWILKVKSNVDSGTFRPLQLAAAKALSENEDTWHNEYNVKLYKRRRAIANQIMDALGCTYRPEQVGMFAWGKVGKDYPSGEALSDRILYEAGVFITPGFIFGQNGEQYIRISLCASEKTLQEALERIKNTNRNIKKTPIWK